MEKIRNKGIDYLLDVEMNGRGPKLYGYNSIDFTQIEDADLRTTWSEITQRLNSKRGGKYWVEDVQNLTTEQLE